MGLLTGSPNKIVEHARKDYAAGHDVFVAQLRAMPHHRPTLTRPIPGPADYIQDIENIGWQLDKMDSLIYRNNVTLVCLFRRKS